MNVVAKRVASELGVIYSDLYDFVQQGCLGVNYTACAFQTTGLHFFTRAPLPSSSQIFVANIIIRSLSHSELPQPKATVDFATGGHAAPVDMRHPAGQEVEERALTSTATASSNPCGNAATTPPHTMIEDGIGCWHNVTIPQVLVIGDSISSGFVGYGAEVKRIFEDPLSWCGANQSIPNSEPAGATGFCSARTGRGGLIRPFDARFRTATGPLARVTHSGGWSGQPGANWQAGNSSNGAACVNHWLGSQKSDVITINFGLHDCGCCNPHRLPKPDDCTSKIANESCSGNLPYGRQVSSVDYEKNLQTVYATASSALNVGGKIVYVPTTPGGEAYASTVSNLCIRKVNAIAQRVLGHKPDVVFSDLHAAVDKVCGGSNYSSCKLQCNKNAPCPRGAKGGHHFQPAGRTFTAVVVAHAVAPLLGPRWMEFLHGLSHGATVKTDDELPCRDRFLSPFGAKSLWNVAIGANAKFVPCNIYAPSMQLEEQGPGPSKAQCANMTKQFSRRHICPGAHSGITAAQCAAKGCCFSTLHCTVPCPWCFTPQQVDGPGSFHNDADHFVHVKSTDPTVTWFMQGWWGQAPKSSCVPTQANNQCHCSQMPGTLKFTQQQIRLPNFVKELNVATPNCNNALSMLQPDNKTVIQTQPAFRCDPGGPLFSLTNGTGPHSRGGPQTYPLTVDITSDLNVGVNSSLNTALGAHGGSGLSALGGVIRLHEIAPADGVPIPHALKLELYAHQYYYGGGTGKRKLQPPSESNGGRTQYVWPATGSDGYTWATCKSGERCLAYGGANEYLVPGALLALPEAAASALIPHLTVPGKRVAAAFRDYGGYIIDDTAGDSASLAWESGANDLFASKYNFTLNTVGGAWYNDLVAIFQELQVVINNKPDSVGGGGTPRQPPLPPLCKIDDTAARIPVYSISSMSHTPSSTAPTSTSTSIIKSDEGKPRLKLDDAARMLRPLAALVTMMGSDSQYLHHSKSPFGPWEEVIPEGCTEGTGVWSGGGGNNPSPYIVDEEASALTGLANNSVVIITTCGQGNRTHEPANTTLRSYMCVGVSKSWRDPVILHNAPLFALPHQNDYTNRSVLTDPWEGWLTEDPFFFFNKKLKKWQALFHQVRRQALSDPKGALQPNGPVDKWSGGYAESSSTQLFGPWTAHSPQHGAYSKDLFLVRHRSNHSLQHASPPRPPSGSPPAPFKLGRTWPVYMNESLTSWGGNALQDPSTFKWHLYTSAMSAGRNHNRHASDLIPGPCGIGSWEGNSLVIHAVSDSPRGPFKMTDVALPSQHTNPQIVLAPDGEWLLYSLGGMNCTKCSNTSYLSPGRHRHHQSQACVRQDIRLLHMVRSSRVRRLPPTRCSAFDTLRQDHTLPTAGGQRHREPEGATQDPARRPRSSYLPIQRRRSRVHSRRCKSAR